MEEGAGLHWICSACTFVNTVGKTAGEKCEVCGLGKRDDDFVLTDEDLAMQEQIMEMERREQQELAAARAELEERERREQIVKETENEEEKAPATKVETSKAPEAPSTSNALSPDKLRAIEAKREAARARGLQDLGEHYRLICPACDKPNVLQATICTGCGFALSKWDAGKVSENVFHDLIRGEDIGSRVLYRDDNFIVFEDRFGVSDVHLDVIPTRHIEDVTCLTKDDIPLIKRMYELGVNEVKKLRLPRFSGKNVDDYIVAGYNYPVSVKQLHLHVALPPYTHDNVFIYPRWHLHSKVLADLEQYGKVRLNQDYPNHEAADRERKQLLNHHRELLAIVHAQSKLTPSSTSEHMDIKVKDSQHIDKGKEKEDAMDMEEKPEAVDRDSQNISTHGYTESSIEKEYEKWVDLADSNGQLIWMGATQNKILMLYDDLEFNVRYPTLKTSKEAFSVEVKKGSPWIQEFNEYTAKSSPLTAAEAFSKILFFLRSKNLKKSATKRVMRSSDSLRISTEGSEGQITDDETEDQSQDLGDFGIDEESMDWMAEKYKNEHMKAVEQEVKDAQSLVGPQQVSVRGMGQVVVSVDVTDVINPALAHAVELTVGEPVLVTIDFAEFWSIPDDRERLPLPKFSCRQWTTTNENSFGVKYHLREIVSRYMEDNWKWSDETSDKKRIRTLGAFASEHSKAGPASMNSKGGWAPKSKKTIRKIIGVEDINNDTKQQLNESDAKEAVERLKMMGFTEEASQTVFAAEKSFEKSVTKLLSMGDSVRAPYVPPNYQEEVLPDLVIELAGMGFDPENAAGALKETSNNVESALELLISGFAVSSSTSTSSGSSGRKKLTSSMDEDIAKALQNEEDERSAKRRELQIGSSLLSNTDTNFFVGMIAYVRARLANYTRYCMICHKKHTCDSDKPVVCCNPLCLFRFSDVLPQNKKEQLAQMSRVSVCPFSNCETEVKLDRSEAALAAVYGVTDTGAGNTQEMLLQMMSHRYLANEDMIDFIENGVKQNNMTITKVENVLKAELVVGFEAAWAELRQKRGDEVARPKMAYHGTAESNIESILERGLLVPGKGKGTDVSHATDSGYWGGGIYLSPNSSMSVGYCRGGSKLLICSVLMGKTYQCTQLIHGADLMSGYDSHTAPGGQEWIIFNPAQVLPCYLVTFQPMNKRY